MTGVYIYLCWCVQQNILFSILEKNEISNYLTFICYVHIFIPYIFSAYLSKKLVYIAEKYAICIFAWWNCFWNQIFSNITENDSL